MHVQKSIDELDAYIDQIFDVHDSESSHDKSPKYDQSLNDIIDGDYDDFEFSREPAMWLNMDDRFEVYSLLHDRYYAG